MVTKKVEQIVWGWILLILAPNITLLITWEFSKVFFSMNEIFYGLLILIGGVIIAIAEIIVLISKTKELFNN